MNELATIDNTAANTVATAGTNDLSQLMQRIEMETKVMEFDERISNKLAESTMIPRAFVGKPADCFAAIQYGRKFGLDPMHSLQNTHVISGRPSFSSQALMGIVLKYADKPPRIEYEVDPKGNTFACTVTYLRSGETYSERYSLDDAKQAGLLNNTGWKNYPKNMLTWRAAVFAARKAFPDVLAGVYTVDEMKDVQEASAAPAPQPKIVNQPEQQTPQQKLAAAARTEEEKAKTLEILSKDLRECRHMKDVEVVRGKMNVAYKNGLLTPEAVEFLKEQLNVVTDEISTDPQEWDFSKLKSIEELTSAWQAVEEAYDAGQISEDGMSTLNDQFIEAKKKLEEK